MLDRQQHMIKLAIQAMHNAYAPYSKFAVGAALRTNNGRYFSGCNVENASYRLTVCAESSAIAQMVAAGETQIESIVIVSSHNTLCPPCGACRQSLREFARDDCQIHLCVDHTIKKTHRLDALLPESFSGSHLEF